jgi:hypothetical protein
MTFLAPTRPPTLRAMATEEPLWRSRLRWRWRGALLWPLFVGLTIADALLLGELPIAGDGGTDLVPALLLASFFNLLAVAVVAPVASARLRRRRRDLPKVIADDYAGAALLGVVTLGFVVGGLIHRPHLRDAEHDLIVQQVAARRFVATQAPAEFRAHAAASDTLKLGEDYFRTCVPGPNPTRWFCVFVNTDETPPGVTVDESRVSNAALSRPSNPG